MKSLPLAYVLLMALLSLVSCGHHQPHDGPPLFAIDTTKIPDATPKAEPLSRYGNPASYQVRGHRYHVMKSAAGYHARGIASWYGRKFHERRTSSGEVYNLVSMTAAHRTLPLPTYARVTNLKNGRQVIVKINDRGPFVANRLIDLSYAAAKKIGMTASGTAWVEVRALTPTRQPSIALRPMPRSFSSQQVILQLGVFQQYQYAKHLATQVKQWSQAPVSIKKIYFHTRARYRVELGPLLRTEATQLIYHRFLATGLSRPILKRVF